MQLFFLKILRNIGLDSATAYTVIGKLWQGAAGLISIFVLAHFLSTIEQGFYFTFGSILTLQVFVELGLSVVIVQFASHEQAQLEWTSSGILIGPRQYKDRLASLIQIMLKWYGVIAILVVILLLPSGYIFFLKQQIKYIEIVWQVPWFCLILSFAVFLYFSPLLGFLEGCGKIKEVAKMRFVQDLVANLLLWAGCFGKLGLWVAALSYLGRSIVILLWVCTGWRKNFFLDMLKIKPLAIISWRKEILPFQWRIALSWISGFFIFQLFNPVLFAYHGAVMAGQMGISLAACNGIAAIPMSWASAKIPVFGNLIAQKKYMELDNLFFRILKQSFVVLLFLVVSFVATLCFLKFMQLPLGSRFLPLLPFLLLNGVVLINHSVFIQATYLRAHKQEPLFIYSLTMACLISISTYFLGKYYSAIGITSGYFVLSCFGSIWVAVVFLQKRELWHK